MYRVASKIYILGTSYRHWTTTTMTTRRRAVISISNHNPFSGRVSIHTHTELSVLLRCTRQSSPNGYRDLWMLCQRKPNIRNGRRVCTIWEAYHVHSFANQNYMSRNCRRGLKKEVCFVLFFLISNVQDLFCAKKNPTEIYNLFSFGDGSVNSFFKFVVPRTKTTEPSNRSFYNSPATLEDWTTN